MPSIRDDEIPIEDPAPTLTSAEVRPTAVDVEFLTLTIPVELESVSQPMVVSDEPAELAADRVRGRLTKSTVLR